MTVREQGDQLRKTHSALQETEHASNERVRIIDQLELTKAELVSSNMLLYLQMVRVSSYLLCHFPLQQFHKNDIQSKLDRASREVKSLNNDVDTLKTGLDAIVEIFQKSAGGCATPIHEFETDDVTSGTGNASVSGKEVATSDGSSRIGQAKSSSLPHWLTSPVSAVSL